VSDVQRDLAVSVSVDVASAARGLDRLDRRVDDVRDNTLGMGSNLGKMGSTFETQMSGLDKSFTLWERNSGEFATTMERKQRQIGLVTDKASLLEKEMDRTTGELVGVTREFGENSEAAGRLQNQLLDLQIRQADYNRELKNLHSFDWAAFDRIGQGFTDVGKKMTLGITTPLMAVGGLGLRTFIDLEDNWAGVQKVTSGTTYELEQLRKEMRYLVTYANVPLPVTEMYGIAQAAGRLGIELDNVKGFAQTTAMLGTVTNMTAEQAATDMAQFATVMQMPQERFEQLGAVLVGLGNNMATTESDIMRMGARLTGAGKTVGLAEAEVLGFAAAFSSLGINAEAGGTAFTTVMLSMQDSIFNMTTEGDDRLKTFARVAGVSADEFAHKFETNASGAIISFVEGLGSLTEAGYNTNEIFSELGFNGVNVQDILRRGAGAGYTLRNAIELANTSWEENTALTEAAGKRYDTTAAQIQVFRNRLTLLSDKIGSDLQHQFRGLIDIGNRALSWMSDLDDRTRRIVVSMGMVAAGIGPVLLGIGAGIKVVKQMHDTIGQLQTGVRGFKAAFGGGKAIGLLMSPVGKAVLAVGALVAVGVILHRNWSRIGDWFENRFPGAFETVTSVMDGVRSFISDNMGSITGVFSGFTDFVSGIFTGDLELAFGGLGEVFAGGFDLLGNLAMLGFGAIFGFFETLIAPLEYRFPFVFGVLSDTLGIFKDTAAVIIGGAKQIFGGLIEFVAGVFTGNWERAWGGVVDVFGGIFGSLGAVVKAPMNAVISIINRAISNINGISVDIPSWVPGIGGRNFGVEIPTIPMLAKGTHNHVGGPAIVGEQGPELVFMPRGSQVIPNKESMGMLRVADRSPQVRHSTTSLGRSSRPQSSDDYNINKFDGNATGSKHRPSQGLFGKIEIIIQNLTIGGDVDLSESRITRIKDELIALLKDAFGDFWEDEWYKLSLKYPNLTET